MNNKRKAKLISIFLLICSFNLLTLALIYYKIEDNIVNYRYSDDSEYITIQKGIDFVSKLPIQINITNKYFSNFDNLDNETRESIILAYAFNNKYNTYKCGIGDRSICIDKEKLNSNELLNKFNTTKEINSDRIKAYIDDYGVYTVEGGKDSKNYKVTLNNDNNNYRKYSKFSHYKEKDGVYIFYFYEGFIKANCKQGDKLELFDFITGDSIYTDTCNGYNGFNNDPSDNIKNIQLYKYELVKDENNNFYLKGYNPVKS